MAGIVDSIRDQGGLWPFLKVLWTIVSARIYLRSCSRLGRMVRTCGKPRVVNMGEMEVGDKTIIFSMTVRSELATHPGGRLEIGSNAFINYGASISAHQLVKIGDRCQISTYAIMMDNDYHQVGDRTKPSESKPIILEDNVWLGARVIVLKGVTIGRNSVIGAGSVVTRDVPPNCLAGGIPARVIKSFDPPEREQE